MRIFGADTGELVLDRDLEVACQRAVASAGAGPKVVHFLREHAALLSEFCPGELLEARHFRDAGVLERVGRTLRRCHDQPAPAGLAVFCPFTVVRDYHKKAQEKKVAFPSAERLRQ